MKISLSIFIGLILCVFNLAYAGNDCTYIITMYRYYSMSDEYTQNDDEGRRIPLRPIPMYLNPDTGIYCDGIDISHIILYEVYDESGNLIASFSDEYEFIEFIFSYSMPVEIRITTDKYTYIGYISN